MTTNTSTFSFQEETIFQTSLDSRTTMRIAKSGPSVARVYFVDSHNTHQEVPIPFDLSIYDDTNHVIVSKIYSTEIFALHWGDNYTIKYNNEVIFKLVTQKKWSITSSSNREIVTITK